MSGTSDWDLLQSLHAVLEAGSFSAAARLRRLTQPTLGRHIDQLERQLGAPLFLRSPRGLQPTDLALAFRPHLADMSAAEQRAFRIGAGKAVIDLVDRGTDQKLLRNTYAVRQIEAALPPDDFDAVVQATLRAGSARRLAKDVSGARGSNVPPDPRIARAVGRLGVIAGASLPGTHPLLAAAVGRQMATASIPPLPTGALAQDMLLPGREAAALARLRPSIAARLPSDARRALAPG